MKDHRLSIYSIVYNFETPASLSTGSRSGGPAPPGAGLLNVQSGHCDGLLSTTLGLNKYIFKYLNFTLLKNI